MSDPGAARWRLAPRGSVAGTVTVPGDKSISHRALMIGALADGDTHITGFLEGEDCLATARALQALGVRLERPAPSEVLVHGVGMHGLAVPAAPLDMGNAGTAMRLMMGVLAPQRFDSILIGDESLMRRPMGRVAVPLQMMGARIHADEGRPPVRIRGTPNLRAIQYSLPVPSAQVKSAVLLAGLYASGVTRVTEPAPTRDHTERMLGAFGASLRREGRSIALDGGGIGLCATRVAVPADFSSAAFFIVAGCLAAERPLLLTNVGVNPTRTGLIELLRRMGADIRLHERRPDGPDAEPVADIEVRRSTLRGITVPESLVPLSIDEFPVFFIAAACAGGETLVRGALELRVKESDRLASMAAGFAALGVEHQLLPDGMWIRGADSIGGGAVDSRGDHRIAMAFAVAALRAQGPIEITDVANVATSFPGFVRTAGAAGLRIETL